MSLEKLQERLEQMAGDAPLEEASSTIKTVKPIKIPTDAAGRMGNDNYIKQVRRLRDLVEAASTQAGQIETQARLLQKVGDTAFTGSIWDDTQKWALGLSNDLYGMFKKIRTRV